MEENHLKNKHVIYGDSVAGDSKIIISGGTEVNIESLFSTVRDTVGNKEYDFPKARVLTYDTKTNKSCYKKIKYIMRHKVSKKMFRIWINNSNNISVTEDHSLMGYLNTNKIHSGEYFLTEVRPEDIGKCVKSLIHLKTIPRSKTRSQNYHKLIYELMGYVIGGGSAGKVNEGVQLSIGKQDMDEVTEKLLQPLVDNGFATSFHVRKNGHDVRICGAKIFYTIKDSLYEWKIKRVPGWMFEETEENISSFIRGYFSADGTVINDTIRLTTVIKQNASDVRTLLFYCGIASNYSTENNPNSYNGKVSNTYSKHLVVRSKSIFKNKVGFILDRKQNKITPVGLPKKITQHYDFELFRPWKIEEIEFNGYVYDIEVEKTHMFFANNILVHNTDSTYSTMKEWVDLSGVTDHKAIVDKIDSISDKVNDSFPEFMDEAFLVGNKRGAIIQAGREVVAKSGLFADNKKKRYALHVIDNEGQNINNDGTPYSKMKIMGMEIVRSDTPAYIQKFLKECITEVVQNRRDYEYLKKMVHDFRINTFYGMNPWERGSPCRVSKLTINAAKIKNYNEKLEEGYVGIEKPRIHFSVTAANNTNQLMKIMNEHHWDTIHDGDKIQVLKLRDNPWDMKSVALKAGEVYIPDWFRELPFDNEAHERKLIDKKLENIIGSILHWEFKRQDDYSDEVFQEVSFFN